MFRDIEALRTKSITCAAVAACIISPLMAQSALTQRISVSSTGQQSNSNSKYPHVTPDGRYVVFDSYATNLDPSDTTLYSDVFVRDRLLGTTTLVSVSTNGAQGDGDSYISGISDDGKIIVFESEATNLVPGDTNNHTDVFVHEMATGKTTRVSVDSAGGQGDGDSYAPVISGNGRFVAFASAADNLVPGDLNVALDVFLYDRVTQITTRVSVDSSGIEAAGSSSNPSIDADGGLVAFDSSAPNLVPGDTNAASDVFVHDNLTGTTTRVSVDSNGVQGDMLSYIPRISAAGHLVAFVSLANNLAANDVNQTLDVFVHDLQTGQTTLVSANLAGNPGNSASTFPAISVDERWIAFQSDATNLVANDLAGTDVYVRDLLAGHTDKMSVSTAGAPGNGSSSSPSISGDGRFVAYYSSANNLVPGDTNGAQDIFLRDRDATSATSLCDPGANGVIACPCANAPSGPGRGCNNSSATGGASISASGIAYLTSDTLVFTTSGEKPSATSIVLQGNALNASGAVFGQGVRCATGALKRLYTKTASAGSITVPNIGGGDPTVSARSSTLGDVIAAGQSRWYLVYYRDPTVLGGCPSASTFNATQTLQIDWSL
jgi:Tol biopolymer transport system component